MATNKRLPGDAKVADMTKAFSRMQKSTTTLSLKTLSAEKKRDLYAGSMSVKVPADNTDRLSEEMESQLMLPVTEIDPYDRNPRQSENDRYEEIKESIRSATVLSPLVVTRRPGSRRYMVAAGGNTRLRAQKELYAETGSSRYATLFVTYRPWRGEVDTLASHLIENELRGSMTFWDRANGVWMLKREMEAESGQTLSLRQFQQRLKDIGLGVGLTLISYYAFALEQLQELGAATARLSKNAVQELQPAFKELSALCNRFGLDDEQWAKLRFETIKALAPKLEADFYDYETDGKRHIRPLQASTVMDALEGAVAERLQQSRSQLSALRQLAKSYPEASAAELTQKLTTPPPPAPPSQSPTAPIVQRSDVVVLEPTPQKVTETMEPLEQAAPSPLGSGADAVANTLPECAQSEHESSDDVLQHIVHFARVCGIADCLVPCPGLPLGYFMEAPEHTGALDLDPSTPDRHIAWWLCATFSGQLDDQYAQFMPEASFWRQAQLMENGRDEFALSVLIEHVLGGAPEFAETARWFAKAPTHVLLAYEQMLHSIRDQVNAIQE